VAGAGVLSDQNAANPQFDADERHDADLSTLTGGAKIL